MRSPIHCAALFLMTAHISFSHAFAEKVIRLGGVDYSFKQLQIGNADYGYFYTPSRWPPERDGKTIIFVCWDNATPEVERETSWVKSAVNSSWQANSNIQFRGWLKCAERNRGIRITIDDSSPLNGPHVKALGYAIDGRPSGMVLNFTFHNWSKSCAATETDRQQCIGSIAVHEFGHAIGFAHEQNRWDRPGECTEAPQGQSGDVFLTPYDKSSVMNYCNPVYNNNGMLSAYDIKALQSVYGERAK